MTSLLFGIRKPFLWDLYRHLQQLGEDGELPRRYSPFGLCSEIYRFIDAHSLGIPALIAIDAVERYLDYIWPTWPEYSGDPSYPVPSCNSELTPKEAYHRCDHYLARDAYGLARRRLILFTAEKLLEELESS